MVPPEQIISDTGSKNPFPGVYQKDQFEDHLCQGDIIVGFKSELLPTYKPPPLGTLILSQTCDLENEGNIHFISLSPIYVLDVYINRLVEQTIRKRGPDIAYERAIDIISEKVSQLANYQDKRLFFLPPDSIFNGSAAFSGIDEISAIPVTHWKELLKLRRASILSPWREKLGFKMGYLYNRVATHTPRFKDIRTWVEANYKDFVKESLATALSVLKKDS